MPSIPVLRESKERCKSVLHRIRAWPVFQHGAAAEQGPNIESRRGRLNRNGDIENGQFADSLVRLMHRRGDLLDEESGNDHSNHSSLGMLAEKEQAGGKKQKRELNLLPGGEPMIVAAYHLVRRLVTRDCHSHPHCHCCSNPKDHHRRHDSCISQSVRLIDGKETST